MRNSSAPINIRWGHDNRTVGLRVPRSKPDARRVENRVVGADANPYVATAVTLACGYPVSYTHLTLPTIYSV